ncbi:MAG TPA: ATP-binding protein [Vicinamibacterales bacterium]|nr:ATP-binding protein [Vicinamibacterales bacterium]
MSLEPTESLPQLQRDVRFHTSLRDLLLAFSRDATSAQSLPQALAGLTESTADLLGVERIDVWLHDRRARELALIVRAARGSDSAGAAGETRVAADDQTHLAVRALRLDHPVFDGTRVLAPLRGWRRALGSMIICPASDMREPEREELLGFSHEISRQLSIAIENVQLLDDILQQRRLLEDTFNSLVDLVVVVDNRLRIVQTNEAFAARAGVSRDELIQRPISDFVSAATLQWLDAAQSAPSAPTGVQPIDDARLGGIFVLTASPLVNADTAQSSGRVLVARDITRQTRLEAERSALRERLAQSEKLASLGQFVAGIAHEMNNPLQGVQGHLELLMMADAARPVRKELRQIYQDADRAAKIVRNLLVFAGSRRMARRRVSVERVIARALASRAASRQRHHIEVVVERNVDALPPVLGDALLLQQAILNILINAEHAVLEQPDPRRRITIATDSADDRVRIVIRDSGAGIPSDVLPRIFDPFFTTKEVGQGTGLGLAITYGIVQEHDGTISAANAAEGGATFCIELPAAASVVK